MIRIAWNAMSNQKKERGDPGEEVPGLRRVCRLL